MTNLSVSELCEIAMMAVEMCGITIASDDCGDFGWRCWGEDSRWFYTCDEEITPDSMQKWQRLCDACTEHFKKDFKLYIGRDGEFDDAHNVWAIEPAETYNERHAEYDRQSKANALASQKYHLQMMQMRIKNREKKREEKKAEKSQTLGDIDALAYLKSQLEK